MEEQDQTLVFDWRRPHLFFSVALAAATSPRRFFAQLPREAGVGAPLLFFLCAQLAPALITFAYFLPQGLGAALVRMVYYLAAPLSLAVACAVLIFVSVQIFSRSSEFTLKQSINIVCYSCGLLSLSFVPWFMSPMAGILISAVMFFIILYLIGVGLRTVGGLPTLHSILVLAFSVLVVASTYLWLKPGNFDDRAAPPPPAQENAVPASPPAAKE